MYPTGLKFFLWLSVQSKFTLTVVILKLVVEIPHTQISTVYTDLLISNLPKTVFLFFEH